MRLSVALRLTAAEARSRPTRPAVVVIGLAIALGGPTWAALAGARIDASLRARAEATPIVIGPRGSPYEVALGALYFRGAPSSSGVPVGIVREIHARGQGLAVPLVLGWTVAGVPLVGTSLDYFALRGLRVASGRALAAPGEVVVGADVARRAGLRPGDKLRTDVVGVPDLAGAHPVGLTVVGVLAAAGSPDDGVAFADLSTIRAIEGHLHAHEVADEHGEAAIEPSAAVYLAPDLGEVAPSALHLHGDPDRLSVSAVIVAPADARARDQLLGDLALDPERQAVLPSEVVGDVLDVFSRARRAAVLWLALSGAVMLAFVGVVSSLSLRLRAVEFALLRRLGAGRRAVFTLIAVELGTLLAAAVVLAAGGVALGLALVDAALR